MFLAVLVWSLARRLLRVNAQSSASAWMLFPPTRSRSDLSGSGCKAPECPGPCDGQYNSSAASAIPIARGELLQITWPRNGHPGGFIRLSLVPAASSGNATAFDDAASLIVCAESECYPPNPINTTSKLTDNALCRTTFTVPSHAQNGPATLQWLYWGGGPVMAQYYSCADLLVEGGSELAAKSPPLTFRGGDLTYPNLGQCRYYNTNALGNCVLQPCRNTKGFVGNGTEYADGPDLSTPVSTYPVTSTPTRTSSPGAESFPFETFVISLASAAFTGSSTTRTLAQAPISATEAITATAAARIGSQIAVDPSVFISGLVIPLAIAAACAACPCLLFRVRDRKRRQFTSERQMKRRRQSRSQADLGGRLPPTKRSTSFTSSAAGSFAVGGRIGGGPGHPRITRSASMKENAGGADDEDAPLAAALAAGSTYRPASREFVVPKLVRAAYDFSSSNSDEMNFATGDCILLHEVYSDGWGRGILATPAGEPLSDSPELMALPLNYVRLV